MPVSGDEWDAAARIEDTDPAPTIPVGEYEDERQLVLTFLSENADNGYSRGEILRGVDFGDDAPPETIREVLTEIQDELVDAAGDVVASGMLVGDLEEALDALVAEGTVAQRAVEDGEGTTTYYRLNTADSRA